MIRGREDKDKRTEHPLQNLYISSVMMTFPSSGSYQQKAKLINRLSILLNEKSV